MTVAVLDEKDLKEFAETVAIQTIEKFETDREKNEQPLDIHGIADYLGVSESTIRREFASDDPIPFGLVRGEKRFYKKDIDEWCRRKGKKYRQTRNPIS